MAALVTVGAAAAFNAFTQLDSFLDSPIVLLGIPLLTYVVAFALTIRHSEVHTAVALGTAIAGLAPLYYLAGAALVITACSFSSGGC